MSRANRIRQPALLSLCLCLIGSTRAEGQSLPNPGRLIVHESFEDTSLASRGWYDGVHLEIVADPTAPDGAHVNQWLWPRAGAINPRGGSARLHLPPMEDVTIGFQLRLSADWSWTRRGYHPHMFSLITNADTDYVGPASTHLTTYAEVVDGIPRLTLQDARNIDTMRIDTNLPWSEGDAVAGCNGDADGHGPGDCYRAGDNWLNGKVWEADRIHLPAPNPATDEVIAWHAIHARYRLNTIADGATNRDGILQMWFDGELIIDVQDAVLRTSRHPDMQFNQLFVGPYYGPGVPHPQSMWIDDLRVWDSSRATAVQPATWGQIKDGTHGP